MTNSIDRLKAALADRYAIQEELGAGGMATVYLAEDLKHHRKVAVKVLRPELAAVLGAERFVKEIETTANLQHPHILPLFDSGGPVGCHGRRSAVPRDCQEPRRSGTRDPCSPKLGRGVEGEGGELAATVMRL